MIVYMTRKNMKNKARDLPPMIVFLWIDSSRNTVASHIANNNLSIRLLAGGREATGSKWRQQAAAMAVHLLFSSSALKNVPLQTANSKSNNHYSKEGLI